MEDKERKKVLKDFRKLLRWFEEHKGVKLPVSFTDVSIYPTGKEEFIKIAKQLGEFKKETTESFYHLKKQFGSVCLTVSEWRTEVCTRKQIGTKTVKKEVPIGYRTEEQEVPVYEWECPETILGQK